LNDVYGTMFWGQTYNDFDEIPMPTLTITTHNPVLKLDWYRFRSASLNQFALEHIACIKEHKGDHQEVTHNFFGGYFDRQYDQNVMSHTLDVVSYDNYPVWGGLKEPLSPAEVAMGLDYMRGLKQKNFWVMEQLIGAQGHDDIGYLPRDGESTLWASQAMARGCESLFYFRYRGAIKGQEQYCQGILDADNRINAKYLEVQRFFKWAKSWQHYFSAPVQAPVALVYDYDNRGAWRGQRQSDAFNYTQELLRFYRPFHAHNIVVDVIDLKKNWASYPVVVMPLLQLIDATLAKALTEYVQQGGILIAGYRHGIKDLDNNLIFGQKAPCYGQSLFGLEVETYEALGEGVQVGVYKNHHYVGSANVWRDLLKPLGAQMLYSYEKPYEDFAAVTKNTAGKGHAFYIGAGLDERIMAAIVSEVISLSGLAPIESPEGLEVVSRESKGQGVYFVMNHLHHSVVFKDMIIEALAVKVLSEDFQEMQHMDALGEVAYDDY
jgi:beta-galactosidase